MLAENPPHPQDVDVYSLDKEGDNRITLKGIHSLVAGNWTNLIHLDLSSNRFGNEGLKYLSRATLNNLATLELGTLTAS